MRSGAQCSPGSIADLSTTEGHFRPIHGCKLWETRLTTKRMARYFADPAKRAVWAQVIAETDRAKKQQRDGEWITYLIRDPRFHDLKGKPGLPIYVGQTNDFPKRVMLRFTKCEKEALAKGKDCIEARVAELLDEGLIAKYQVIDRQPTRLSSLVSETNMARRAWKAGYKLVNQRRLQNKAGDDVTLQMIPREWLLEFTLAEGLHRTR
jgi:hypothetical protein